MSGVRTGKLFLDSAIGENSNDTVSVRFPVNIPEFLHKKCKISVDWIIVLADPQADSIEVIADWGQQNSWAVDKVPSGRTGDLIFAAINEGRAISTNNYDYAGVQPFIRYGNRDFFVTTLRDFITIRLEENGTPMLPLYQTVALNAKITDTATANATGAYIGGTVSVASLAATGTSPAVFVSIHNTGPFTVSSITRGGFGMTLIKTVGNGFWRDTWYVQYNAPAGNLPVVVGWAGPVTYNVVTVALNNVLANSGTNVLTDASTLDLPTETKDFDLLPKFETEEGDYLISNVIVGSIPLTIEQPIATSTHGSVTFAYLTTAGFSGNRAVHRVTGRSCADNRSSATVLNKMGTKLRNETSILLFGLATNGAGGTTVTTGLFAPVAHLLINGMSVQIKGNDMIDPDTKWIIFNVTATTFDIAQPFLNDQRLNLSGIVVTDFKGQYIHEVFRFKRSSTTFNQNVRFKMGLSIELLEDENKI